MLAFVWTVFFVLLGWAPFLWWHWEKHGVVNPTHVVLTMFNAINVLICFWEHSLWLHRANIKKEYKRLKRRGHDKRLPTPLCLFQPITTRQAFSYRYWSVIWSQYALLDPSYADQTSFGFWIDSGNGIITMPVTVLLSFGATFDDGLVGLNLSPKTIAKLGLVCNYQMLYGTVLYFANYLLNEHWRGASRNSILVVVMANCIWIVFPALWMRVCWRVVETGDWAGLR